MANGHGGKREGAGRPKGSTDFRKILEDAVISEHGSVEGFMRELVTSDDTKVKLAILNRLVAPLKPSSEDGNDSDEPPQVVLIKRTYEPEPDKT